MPKYKQFWLNFNWSEINSSEKLLRANALPTDEIIKLIEHRAFVDARAEVEILKDKIKIWQMIEVRLRKEVNEYKAQLAVTHKAIRAARSESSWPLVKLILDNALKKLEQFRQEIEKTNVV